MATQSKKTPASTAPAAPAASADAGSYLGNRVTLRYCDMRRTTPPPTMPAASDKRARLLLVNLSKWMNGTTLTYAFCTTPAKLAAPAEQRNSVRAAFAEWKALGIGLNFSEVPSIASAQIRIAFDQTDGSWSYIGMDNENIDKAKPTMNFGWDLTTSYGHTTALHEIGHAIGFPHEHQNPLGGIVWDEPAVYASLAAPPNNWPHDETFHNIIEKLVPDTIQGSKWDPDSVMHYQFEKGLILKPVKYKNGLTPKGGLSPRDKKWVKAFYPLIPSGTPVKIGLFQSQALKLKAHEQADFQFIAPAARSYTFRTFGEADTVLAISRKVESKGKAAEVLGRDDDGGHDRNATVQVTLKKGEKVDVKVRMRYIEKSGEAAVMVW